MAPNLGAAFLRCAIGPVNYAGGCIISGKVPDGLRELAADNLHGGFQRGVEEAANGVGVSVPDVEQLLPMDEVRAAAAQLGSAQSAALAAWGMYAGQLGGMLAGVGDLTVDGRTPDVSNFLERLSKKVVRDPPLSVPLHDLSLAIGVWLDLVERCGELLAHGDVLVQAYRRRRIRRALLVALGAIALLALLPLGLWVRAARVRVDAVLASADPCAALDVAAKDLERASSTQKQRVADRRVACQDKKRQAAEALEVARLREEKAREEERVRNERIAKCDALAAHVAAGEVQIDDAGVADGKGPLLMRVAKRALTPPDMAEAKLPCADTAAGPKLAAAFAAAILASPAAWANADDVSERVAAVLIEHKADLPKAPKYQLLAHADFLVKRALFQKAPGAADQAARVCKLKDDLAIRGARFCPALAALRAAGKL